MNNWIKQGDGLSTTLFNIIVEGVIRACDIKGIILEKSVQLIAYVGDWAIITNDRKSIEKTCGN